MSRASSLAFVSTTYPSRCLEFLSKVGNGSNTDASHRNKNVITNSQPTQLRILVVGAGLGGLGTAIALARQGFKVEVLEQATALGEVGAGIQIPPNSGRLLRKWGVMRHLQEHAVKPNGIFFRRWECGNVIGFTDLTGDFLDNYAEPYFVARRSDFHAALYERAKELGVQVHLKSRVEKYDIENGSIVLSDSTVHEGDLIVAADGIKSKARKMLYTDDSSVEPKTSGYAAYRATVPRAKMAEIPELRPFLEQPNLNVWIGPERHVMSYSIAGGGLFNLVLSHRDLSDHTEWSKLSQEEVIRDMQKEFDGWDPVLQKIISLVDHALKWPLMSGNPLNSWVSSNNRLVILGDAAHAMYPYMSQGAAMAIEDGAALAVALGKINCRQELGFALRAFEKERIKRSGWMQEASAVNSMIWHFTDGPIQQARDDAMRAEVERRPFQHSANQWSDPVTQAWAYGYDAENELETSWKMEEMLEG